MNNFKKQYLQYKQKHQKSKVIGYIGHIITFGLWRNRREIEKNKICMERSKEYLLRYEKICKRSKDIDSESITINMDSIRKTTKHLYTNLIIYGKEDYGHDWDNIKEQILERDNYVCKERDGSCHGPLQAHHIIPLSKGGTNLFDNLIILCKYHHSLKHEHMRGKI